MSLTNSLRETIKFPTSLIIRGAEPMGIELTKSLLDQGGFVILADSIDREKDPAIIELNKYKLFRFLNIADIGELDDPLRRLDYVFYFAHSVEELSEEISSQEFLEFSKFLDQVLKITKKFESKLLVTTSIKAHQQYLSNTALDINFNIDSSIHTVYTLAEIQKYTESLVNEYIQKTSIDARIIRLGEIIGEGIEYSPNTTLGRLIKESIEQDSMTIYGDGLDSEYYVHLQDAVYGLIKAQFTKNTRGETFSLSYEYDISTLSIAYKLNDYTQLPKEIKFSSQRENDVSIRLYKPAPNLMRVGWKPRVGFERALKQTYIYSKKYFEREDRLDSLNKDLSKEKKKNLKTIVNDIFYEKEEENVETKEFGALGRLIAERRSQANGRKGSIVLANEHLAKKLKKKNPSFISRITNSIRKNFDQFAKKHRGLKNLTIREFIFYTVGTLIFLYIYINFFSVVLSFGRNVYVAYQSVNVISKSIDENDRTTLVENINILSQNMDSAKKKIEELEYFSFIPVFKNFTKDFDETNLGLEKAIKGIDYSIKGSEGIIGYIENFNPNIVYRPNSSSLLSLQDIQTFEQYTEKMGDNLIILDEGLRIVAESRRIMNHGLFTNLAFENSVLENQYKNFNEKLKLFEENYNTYKSLGNTINLLLSQENEQKYIVLFSDNTYAMPAGGRPVSILTLDFNKGGLDSLKMKEYSSEKIDMNNFSQYLLDKINNTRSISVDANNVQLEDLLYLQEGNLYMDELARRFSQLEGKRIDGIIIINSSFLTQLLELSGPVEYDGVKFEADTYIKNLDLLVSENENPYEYRSSILTNIFAVSLQSAINNFSSNPFDFYKIFNEGIKNKDIVFRLYANSFPNKTENSDMLIPTSPDFLSVNVLTKSQSDEPRTLPKYEISGNVFIKKDLSTKKTVNIDVSEITNIEALIVCLPTGSSNFEFSEMINENKTIRFGETETCIRFTTFEENQVQFTYDTISFENILGGDNDYVFGIRKQPGAKIDYEFKFSSEEKKISKNGSEFQLEYNENGEMTNDLVFGIILERE